ncbi:hypothetical protein V6N13_054579 [Hibiscus sabdariffa]
MAHTSDVARPLANYPQDIWGHHLLSLPFNQQEFDFYTNQVEGLKETVKDMVMDPTTDPLEKVHLINSLCRLGVSYHFESEIEEQLNHLFIILPELLNDKDYSLHTVALVFQVFRFNGYKMSCDFIDNFRYVHRLMRLKTCVILFEISAIDELPTDNQKTTYETLLSSTNEAEDVIQKEGRSYAISYVEKEWKNYAEAEEAELRWKHEAILPTFDDYLENGLYSGASLLNMTQIMLGISEADQNTYEWMTNNTNNLPRAVQICTRLYNDIVTDEVEEKRGLVTASACYMKQHNVSRDEAVRAFRAMIADAWKDVNENSMRLTAVPMRVMKVAVCYLRLLDFAYRDHDAYTSPRISFKRFITKVLIEPIPLD